MTLHITAPTEEDVARFQLMLGKSLDVLIGHPCDGSLRNSPLVQIFGHRHGRA